MDLGLIWFQKLCTRKQQTHHSFLVVVQTGGSPVWQGTVVLLWTWQVLGEIPYSVL